jgi:hypothetical protein
LHRWKLERHDGLSTDPFSQQDGVVSSAAMPDPPPIIPLDYLAPDTPEGHKDAEYWRWFAIRLAYRLGLAALFCVVAFDRGPNLFNFGKLTPPTPQDFVNMVQRDGVPPLRAILAYQRDKGALPASLNDLVPRYLPSEPHNVEFVAGILFVHTSWNHTIAWLFQRCALPAAVHADHPIHSAPPRRAAA